MENEISVEKDLLENDIVIDNICKQIEQELKACGLHQYLKNKEDHFLIENYLEKNQITSEVKKAFCKKMKICQKSLSYDYICPPISEEERAKRRAVSKENEKMAKRSPRSKKIKFAF
jgi:hypothetical protein